jgi:hypothetical protein
MIEEEEPPCSCIILEADSLSSYSYWRRGLTKLCSDFGASATANKHSVAAFPSALRDSDVSPPPQIAALMSWIKHWISKASEPVLATCDLALFAVEEKDSVGIAAGLLLFVCECFLCIVFLYISN